MVHIQVYPFNIIVKVNKLKIFWGLNSLKRADINLNQLFCIVSVISKSIKLVYFRMILHITLLFRPDLHKLVISALPYQYRNTQRN